ncbi:MAG: ribonuclease HII [Nitrospirota bacterium]
MAKKRQEDFDFGEGLVPSLYFFETDLAKQGYILIGGVDEAGRGPLAGPVVAGCVVLKPGQRVPNVNDSKKLTENQRDVLCTIICAESQDFGVGIVEADEIDRVNIYQASKKAMLLAVEELKNPPDFLLIDAMTLEINIPQRPLIKGDARSASIAAASILAKTTRDRIMLWYDRQYPEYGFAGHKGYCCKQHFEALRKHGPSPIHRITFRGVLAENCEKPAE